MCAGSEVCRARTGRSSSPAEAKRCCAAPSVMKGLTQEFTGKTLESTRFSSEHESIAGILRYGSARLVDFTLWNWIEIVAVLEILPKSGQDCLSR